MNDKFRILYIVYTKDTHIVHDVVTEFSESIDDGDLQDFYTLFENKCERSGVQLCAIIPQGETENPNVFVTRDLMGIQDFDIRRWLSEQFKDYYPEYKNGVFRRMKKHVN